MAKIKIMRDGVEELIDEKEWSPPAMPVMVRPSLYKTEIYQRMSNVELDVFDSAIEQADRRTRLMWRDCLEVQADNPLFEQLKLQLTAAFGQERAEAILSLEI